MRPSFHPRLVNGPFDDPGLFLSFLYEKRALLFDLGDIYTLSARDILKISHVFISHTHMDHFVGFDRLLRLFLGREKNLCLYGPEGFLSNIEGKLAGYTWNLVNHYSNRFSLEANEVRPDHLITRRYHCSHKFMPCGKAEKKPFSGLLLEESALSVSCAILDHSIPCLGFSFKERFHVNIKRDQVTRLGLEVGPWLKTFKEALYQKQAPDSIFTVSNSQAPTDEKTFVLGNLADQIAVITPGQKIAYIADAVYCPANVEQIVTLAKGADQLFIESAFLDKDKDVARSKYHLTARQAGEIATRAAVKQLTIFHFSPRYIEKAHLLEAEARQAFTPPHPNMS